MSNCYTTYAKWPYLVLLALLANIGLGGGVSDALHGLLLGDIVNNASYTAHTADVGSTQLFARQRKTCPIPAPWNFCPDGVHCCSAAEICVATSCCPRGSVICNNRLCLEPGFTCCGDSGCPAGTNCRKSSNGRYACCPSSDDVACDNETCKFSPFLTLTCAHDMLTSGPRLSGWLYLRSRPVHSTYNEENHFHVQVYFQVYLQVHVHLDQL